MLEMTLTISESPYRPRKPIVKVSTGIQVPLASELESVIAVQRHHAGEGVTIERLHVSNHVVVIELTDDQLNACPRRFRCYVCTEHHSQKDLAGIVLGQRICRHCAQYASEWLVGRILRFDRRKGFTSNITPEWR